MMDSFCCRCGARLSPGARFCHRCGHPCRPPERTGSSAAGKSMDWEGTAEKGLALLRRYWLAAALAVWRLGMLLPLPGLYAPTGGTL